MTLADLLAIGSVEAPIRVLDPEGRTGHVLGDPRARGVRVTYQYDEALPRAHSYPWDGKLTSQATLPAMALRIELTGRNVDIAIEALARRMGLDTAGGVVLKRLKESGWELSNGSGRVVLHGDPSERPIGSRSLGPCPTFQASPARPYGAVFVPKLAELETMADVLDHAIRSAATISQRLAS